MARSVLRRGLLALAIAVAVALGGCISARDSDKDGFPDDEDHFPDDPSEWVDTDNDDVGDNSDAFPNDQEEWEDSDGDGYGDNSDIFPTNESEWQDSDGDGHGDNSDAFPNEPEEWRDTDADGYGDNADEFPKDPTYHLVCVECNGTGVIPEVDELEYTSSAELVDRGTTSLEWHAIVRVTNIDVEGGIFTANVWIVDNEEEVWSGQQRHFIGAGETYEFDMRAGWLDPSIAQDNLRHSVTSPSWLTGLVVPCEACDGKGKT